METNSKGEGNNSGSSTVLTFRVALSHSMPILLWDQSTSCHLLFFFFFVFSSSSSSFSRFCWHCFSCFLKLLASVISLHAALGTSSSSSCSSSSSSSYFPHHSFQKAVLVLAAVIDGKRLLLSPLMENDCRSMRQIIYTVAEANYLRMQCEPLRTHQNRVQIKNKSC